MQFVDLATQQKRIRETLEKNIQVVLDHGKYIMGPEIKTLENRLADRKHAVIVVAEGAGQKFFMDDKTEQDASGNIKLKDIGLYLKETISSYFTAKGIDHLNVLRLHG